MREALAQLGLSCTPGELLFSGKIFGADADLGTVFVLDDDGYRLFANAAGGCLEAGSPEIGDQDFAAALVEEAGTWLAAQVLEEPGTGLKKREPRAVAAESMTYLMQAICCEIQHADAKGCLALYWPRREAELAGQDRIGDAIGALLIECEAHLDAGRYRLAEICSLKPGARLPLRASGQSPLTSLRVKSGIPLANGMLGMIDGRQMFRNG